MYNVHIINGRDSVVGKATDWKFQVSNPGGSEIIHARPDGPWSSPRLLYNQLRVCFWGVKQPGRGIDHPRHLALSEASWSVPDRSLPITFIVCTYY
jgi:hypothetical protein